MAASVGFGPTWPIDGPPPLPPLYGLLQAADKPLAAPVRLVTDVDDQGRERWINGASVYPYPPDLADVFDPCEGGSLGADEKGFGEDLAQPDFGAMTLWLAETCTTRSVYDEETFQARAVAALSAVEGAGIAREFLSGRRMPLNPHLSDGNGTFPNNDTVTNVVNGLALLEQEIAKSGRQGLIHIDPMVATALVGGPFAIENTSGVLRTVVGTVVIPDAGYVFGATPAGHQAATGTQSWMYASGPVDIRRSDLFVMPGTFAEAIDRGTGGATTGRPNSVTYRAERYYLVDWDTEVQAAVLVDRCQPGCTAD